MTKILIADPSKASLVMSSEVFKDKIPGAIILVAHSGKDAIEILSEQMPDMCVIDFDLPDADGVTLIQSVRKKYKGPILLTAFPGPVVEEAVNSDLFAFNDAGGWVPKPIKFDVLSAKIEQFITDKHRLGKRFDIEALDTLLVGKGAGRGKRAPKAKGKIVNLSLGGACISLDEPMKMKGGQELTVTLSLPLANKEKVVTPPAAKRKKTRTSATTASKRANKVAETKIKATVAWFDRSSQTAGFQFARLTELQKRGLEELLRNVSF